MNVALPDTGWQQLLDWQRHEVMLAFVYTRSLGGLMQTGHCRITSLEPEKAVLETAGSKLMIVLLGARFEAGAQIFFTLDLTGNFSVDGVTIHFANHDSLFLSNVSLPAEARLP
ncbi:MAG: hypothetical protein V4633_10850 [Pseudomonadota bacterium]